MSERDRNTDVSIKVRSATNSPIIGVKEGPSEEELREALREELQPLLAIAPEIAERLRSTDPESRSIYVCTSSTRGSTLGFAVNNSGLIVCLSAVGPICEATEISSQQVHHATVVEQRRMLQVVSINASSRGLVPAYRPQPELREELYAWDAEGSQTPVTVHAIHMAYKIGSGRDGLLLSDGFMAVFDATRRLIGGPVITKEREVLGIGVASARAAPMAGMLLVQPWSALDRCIDMDLLPLSDIEESSGSS